MATNDRTLDASPQQIWDVLADGWLYPVWVVGASRMREVDADWPEVGSRLHHSVGSWPLLLDDNTEVVESVPMFRLVLHARAWPAGVAKVTLTVEALAEKARVTIEEDVIDGPAKLMPKPLRDASIGWRNVETLRRLAFIAERRSKP
jgi:hypothetical protein